MTIESSVADLTTATTNLLSAVNVQKATLDASVATATAQVGLATTQAGLASGSKDTATAQASLAAGYAASAGSAIQQDISGVTAAALHRSPNAVVAMFVYDTTKDSDGGAWTEKCQHTSWYNESLNGKWLGSAATEAAARAVSGATTGDYFQLTSDGKFYKLNSGSGTTEVFRGNKAKFPKLAALVVEAQTVTIYDLTEPGRPMWMRFVRSTSTSAINMMGHTSGSTNSGVAALNGELFITNSGSGQNQSYISMTADRGALVYDSAYADFYNGNIAERNSYKHYHSGRDFARIVGPIAHRTCSSVAMIVLPEAPVDPVSGLQVPTIAIATAGGVSVIKHDGAVVNKTILSRGASGVSFTSDGKLGAMFYSDNAYSWYLYPDLTATSTEPPVMHNNTGWSGLSDFFGAPIIGPVGKVDMVFGAGSTPRINKIKGRGTRYSLNSLNAAITDKFNTGYQVGDIRRVYLADSVVESVTGTELVANGTFADTTGWSTDAGGTIAAVGGELQLTTVAGTPGNAYCTIATVPGKSYRISAMVRVGTTGAVTLKVGKTAYANDLVNTYTSSGSAVPLSGTFVATGTTTYVGVGNHAVSGGTGYVDNVSVKECSIDRSYKGLWAAVFGTLTKSLSAVSNQLVAYSGFSAANYLQEPYSADLDFGTGEWNISAWVNIPVSMPYATLPVTSTEAISNAADRNFTSDTGYWQKETNVTIAGNALTFTGAGNTYGAKHNSACTPGIGYQITYTIGTLTSGGFQLECGGNKTPVRNAVGTYTETVLCGNLYSARIYAWAVGSSTTGTITSISVKPLDYTPIAERSYSSGAYLRLGVYPGGQLVATAFDGTTTREVITPTAYNTSSMLKARAVYRLDGSLSIMVNGVEVAVTRGNPLLTLNNSNAVLTIGNSYALDAPFPGSIALLKLSATAPTPDQSAWMYEQEKHLFRDGANCLLPDSGNIVDLTYDEATDKWIAVSAANESDWTGLVRTNVIAVPAGANIKAAAGSGFKLNARSTTSPGVDVTIPAWNLREELVKRAEAAAKKAQPTVIFDYSGGFTATTVNGNTAITSVASLTYPAQGSLIGATVTGTGIPASTVIVAISGTNIYLSKACTASNSAVQIALSDFILPVGYEARAVVSAGSVQQEGSTKSWVRSFDGFREKVTFNAAPSYSAFIEIQAVRSLT